MASSSDSKGPSGTSGEGSREPDGASAPEGSPRPPSVQPGSEESPGTPAPSGEPPTAPVEITPFEEAPFEATPFEEAPFEATPFEEAPFEDSVFTAEALEASSLDDAPFKASAEVPPPMGGRKEMEPWFLLEPLPSLEQIVPEHIAYVRMVVARFSVTPRHWREDLAQEVLLQAYRSRKSRLEVRALLFGITRHVVLKWMAKQNAERTALALHWQPWRDAGRTVEDEWQEAQRREAVRSAIEEIAEPFREIFIRSELESWTMPEVARALGIPVNTGYTRLHVARSRFLDALHRLLARRGIQKQDLSIPLAIAASGALEGSAGGGSVSPDPSLPGPVDPVSAPHTGGNAGALGKLAPWLTGGAFTATAATVIVWIALSPASAPPQPSPHSDPYSTPSESAETAPHPSADPAAPSAEARVQRRRPNEVRSAESAAPSAEAPVDAADADAGGDAAATWEALAALRVIRIADNGNIEEATLAAAAFWEKYPKSPYTVSIQAALKRRPPPVMDTR